MAYLSKLTAFTDYKSNMIQTIHLVIKGNKYNKGKGESNGYKHFSYSKNVFKSLFNQDPNFCWMDCIAAKHNINPSPNDKF